MAGRVDGGVKVTNEEIAESVVNMGRGAYKPNDVVALILRAISIAECQRLNEQADRANEDLKKWRKG